MASKNMDIDVKKIPVDDVKGTNRVMIIVGIVVLVTFVIVMVLMNSSGQRKAVVPSNVKKVVVEFEIKNRGKIQMELQNDLMPRTVDNFVNNILNGIYKNRMFFRVDNYMVVAGSPTDQAGFDNGEPMSLEYNPKLTVERYCIGMGKDTKANLSSSAIFFVAKAKESDFNGKYAVFGKLANVDSQKVIDSLELNDLISDAKVLTFDDKPYVNVP